MKRPPLIRPWEIAPLSAFKETYDGVEVLFMRKRALAVGRPTDIIFVSVSSPRGALIPLRDWEGIVETMRSYPSLLTPRS